LSDSFHAFRSGRKLAGEAGQPVESRWRRGRRDQELWASLL